MTVFYEWLTEASLWWWPRFADHLWQTTLFAVVVAVAAFALRRGPARLRHNFWLLASAKFIVPAVLFVFVVQLAGIDSLPFFRDVPPEEQNASLVTGVTEPVSAIALDYEVTVIANATKDHKQIYLGLTAVWLAGFAALVSVWTIRRRSFLRSLKLGRRLQTGREWQALSRARETLQMSTEVGLLISPLQIEPAAWRVWRPVVVMPESIANQLNDEELEAIMLHELIHIQRHDNLIANLQLALCALLWFHPLVWFLSRRLFDEREQACDERVMEICGAPEVYASSILKVVRFCFGWKVAGVTGAASGSNLRRRIENIMTRGNSKRRVGAVSTLLAGTLVGVALLVLVGAGVYSQAQDRKAASEVAAVSNDKNPVSNVENAGNATNIDDVSGAPAQKRKQVPPPPPPTEAPPQPSQPPHAAEAVQPPSQPEAVQPPQPGQAAQVPQPSRVPNRSGVPNPAQAPRPSRFLPPPPPPEPAQEMSPPQPAAASVGTGKGSGIGTAAPAFANGGGRGVGVGSRAPGASSSTMRPGVAIGAAGGVGVGNAAPSASSVGSRPGAASATGHGVGSGASAPSSSSPRPPAAAPAPRAVPAKQEKSRPREKVDKGALIEAPHPVYPVEAREQKIQGTVRVDVLIDENGKVVSAKAKSGPEQLHSASQDAAYKARFKPAIINGKPVEIAGAISYNFVIR